MSDQDDVTKVGIDFLIQGMILCSNNASNLAEDARSLYSQNRYSSGGMLAIASLEESGKIMLLNIFAGVHILRYEFGVSEKEYWREFHKLWTMHRLKQVLASFIDLLLFDKEALALAKQTMLKGNLTTIRNNFLYVDEVNNKWITPMNSSKKKAREYIEAAEAISEHLTWEFSNQRRHQIYEDMFNPEYLDRFLQRRSEVFTLLKEEGFEQEEHDE